MHRFSSWSKAVGAALAVAVLPASVFAGGELAGEINVSWNFGSGPGKTSPRFVGEKRVPVTYATRECMERFSLESVRYEFARVEGSESPGPAFVMLRFKKHFAGDFALLPKVSVVQSEVDQQMHATGRKQTLAFPFRDRRMAAPVADWSKSEIDVRIGAPGAVTGFNNPFDWSEIVVSCE